MAGGPEPADHVVDASALAKLFLDEPESQAFREWYLREVRDGARFAAPSLLAYEVAHLLSRNLRPPSGQERRAWLAERHDEVMSGIALDELAARSSFAWTSSLTGYDASYVGCAYTMRATLVSYDEELLREAKRQGIRTLAPR